jgi:SAM-dependent methyltransferase
MTGGFACALCGGTRSRAWRSDSEWQVVRCTACDLLATWPRPDQAALSRLYESPEYFDERSMDRAAVDAGLAQAREILLRLPSSDGPILDFGAGTGHLVHAVRALGVPIDGVEPSSTARTLARDLYGIDLMSNLPDAQARYGAVTLIHVLEHLPDPVAELKRLRPHMTTDGVIFIEVPHAGSADLWLPARRRLILDLPVHLHHFTPKTLGAVLAKAGYAQLEVRLFNPYPIERILAWRAAPTEPASVAAGADSHTRTAPRSSGGQAIRALWRRVLASARSAFPGGHFRVLARTHRTS